jgi:hypothetical protein
VHTILLLIQRLYSHATLTHSTSRAILPTQGWNQWRYLLQTLRLYQALGAYGGSSSDGSTTSTTDSNTDSSTGTASLLPMTLRARLPQHLGRVLKHTDR